MIVLKKIYCEELKLEVTPIHCDKCVANCCCKQSIGLHKGEYHMGKRGEYPDIDHEFWRKEFKKQHKNR